MAKYQNLINSISSVIRTNGNNEITGQILQDVLKSIVNVVGANPTYGGVAHPADNPGTPDGGVVYIASDEGTYVNFGGLTLASNELAVLVWDGTSWSKESVTYIEDLGDIEEAKQEALDAIAEAIQGLNIYYTIETDKGATKDVQLKDGQGNKLMPRTGESNVETKSYQYKLGDARTVEASQSYYITNTFTPLEKNKEYHVRIKSSSPANRTYSVKKLVGSTNHGDIASYPEGTTEIEFDFNTGDYAINRFQITANNIAMTWTVEVFDIITENLEKKLDYLMTGKYTPSPYCSVSGSGSGWITLTQHQHTIHPGMYCRLDIRLGSASTKDIKIQTLNNSTLMEVVGVIPIGSETATLFFAPTKSYTRYQVISSPTITIHIDTYVVSDFLRDNVKNLLYLNESSNYRSNILSLAHQGYSIDSYSSYGQCKEEAMVASYYNKFDGVEVDLIFSSDDVPFLSHDPSFVDLDTSNSITIANETAENLITYNYYGGKIQSLEECLITCKKLGLLIYLDHTGTITSQTKADNVINLIDKYRMWGNIIFTTASTYFSAQILKSHYDDVTIASVYSRAITADDISALNTMAESYHVFASFTYNLNSIESLLPLIANLNKKVKLAVWTVDNVEVYNQYLPYVDCVISNRLSDFIAKTGMRYITNITL